MAIIDTLKLARELRDKGGFSQEAAEATAEALNDALGDEIATKRDVTDLNTGLGGEMAQLRTGLSGEMVQLRTDLRGEMAQLRSDLRDDVGLDMKTLHTKSDNRLAALIIRATRDAAMARRLIYTVLAKAHGPEFAQKTYETAIERVGKELAARPTQSEHEP